MGPRSLTEVARPTLDKRDGVWGQLSIMVDEDLFCYTNIII